MRAAILREYGQPPEPGEFDEPQPGEGQVVLDVLAAGMNPVDLAMTSGTFYAGSPPLPSVVGREGVGRTPDGQIVYFDSPVAPYGSFAEQALVNADSTIPLPAELDPKLAVAFGTAGLAAWLALEWRAQVEEGETVLVLGASGVVGQIAVQAAKLLGAARVVAAARSAAGLKHAQELGADAIVQIGQVDDLAKAFQEASGEGVDVVIDPVWGEPAAAALEACRPHARHVQIGQSAGSHATISSAAVRGKMLAILGHTNFRAPQEIKRAAYQRMVEHAARGELTVEVEWMALDQAAEAWSRQRSSPHHKLVLVP
ncbi:MAG: quinone oxidoreductase family protein [Solirubrobacteraceae bacterium]